MWPNEKLNVPPFWKMVASSANECTCLRDRTCPHNAGLAGLVGITGSSPDSITEIPQFPSRTASLR